MASNQKELEAYNFVLESVSVDGSASSASTTRRSRRDKSTASPVLSLRRETDGMVLRTGDTILVQQKGADKPEVAFIKEIKYGIVNFIEIVVTWFIRMEDIVFEDLPKVPEYADKSKLNTNELFLTVYLEEIFVSEIVEKVNVLSYHEFEDIIIDDSNASNTFMARRACSSEGDNITEEINYRDLCVLFENDPNAFVDFLGEATETVQRTKTPKQTPQLKKVKTNAELTLEKNVTDEEDDEEKEIISTDKGGESSSVAKRGTRRTRTTETKRTKKSPKKGSPQRKSPKKINITVESEEIEEEEIVEKDEVEQIQDSQDAKVINHGDNDEYIKEQNGDESSDEDDLSASASDDLDSDEAEVSESDEEFQVETTRKRPTRQQKRIVTPSRTKSPAKKPRLTKQEKIKEFMDGVLASPSSNPRQKFKVRTSPKKQTNILSSLKIQKTSGNFIKNLDTSSKAFKEIKEKLHSSQAISHLIGREEQFASIYVSLMNAIEQETGCSIYVCGTPGVGKTAVVRAVINQLKEDFTNGFDYLEINGLKLLSPAVAYEQLWEKISGVKVTAANAALFLENYFKNDAKRKPLVVVMDELDQIVTQKQNVMYNFFNWPTYASSKLIVIAIANTLDLPERVLSNKISSRLGLARVEFHAYSYDQLGEIIAQRLKMLTEQSKQKVAIKDDAVGFASRNVSRVRGDARRVLSICRRAVEIAEQEYIEKKNEKLVAEDEIYNVQIPHIAKAINESINSPLAKYLESLPFGSKLLLVAVVLRMRRSGLGENSLGDVIDEMKQTLQMFTSQDSTSLLKESEPNVTLSNFLYASDIFDLSNGVPDVRISHFKRILNELVEGGVLTQQNIPGERYRQIRLHVSQEEVVSVLKRDNSIAGMI
ncbi:hypothetical protein G9P44_004419 [Scheffersomyces stipitis]|nr:hypothetical protein G9P44_004419 [Scheffersomyces stipitis]